MTKAIVVRIEGDYVITAQGADLLSAIAGQASAARDEAVAAAAVALAAGGVGEYPDTGAGLSGTTEGETFWVDMGDGTGQVYRHDPGPTATPLQKFIIDPTDPGAADIFAGGVPTTAALASSTGGEMVGFKQFGSGSVERDVLSKLLEMPISPEDFGATGDGVTDDTSAFAAWWAEMQASQRAGRLGKIGAETRYLIDPGTLEWTFDNTPTIDATGYPGPMVFVDGKTTLVSTGAADAPMISIHNDPNAGGRFVQGGFIEGLRFEDTSVGGTETQRHGIELYGVNGMRFGPMVSTAGLRGDLVHIKAVGDTITGDAWQVFGCVWEGVTLWSSPYYAFNNQSLSQYFNSNTIFLAWALGSAGALKGIGSCNTIHAVSAGWCTDWGVDLSGLGTSVQSVTIDSIEIDACRYGVRFSGIQNCNIGLARFIYRNGDEFSSLGIPPGTTWPETALSFDDVEGGRVNANITLDAFHRFNDINIGQLPSVIADYNDVVSHQAISIRHRAIGLSAPPALYRGNVNGNTSGIFSSLNGIAISDTRSVNLCIARCTSRTGGANYDGSDPVDFQSVQVDQAGAWDAGNNRWVCPADGVYSFHVRFLIQPSAGDLVRVGMFQNADTAPFRESHYIVPDGLGASKAFPVSVSAIHPMSAGDTVKVCLYEANNRALLGGTAGIPANNYFEIAQVQA